MSDLHRFFHQADPDSESLNRFSKKLYRGGLCLFIFENILFMGSVYNRGIGLRRVETSGTKFFAHLSPNFRINTCTSILLWQTTFVTSRPNGGTYRHGNLGRTLLENSITTSFSHCLAALNSDCVAL